MEGGRADAVAEFAAVQPVHHPYASLNWIRFVGSLRCAGLPDRPSVSQPLVGTPRVNTLKLRFARGFVNRRADTMPHIGFPEVAIPKYAFFQGAGGG